MTPQQKFCSKCGEPYDPIVIYRTLRKRGTGAEYATKITHLNAAHVDALKVLSIGFGTQAKPIPAIDFNSGMELTDVWAKVRELRFDNGIHKIPTKQGMSGRLSELQNVKPHPLTHSEDNHISQEDKESQSYRGKKHFQRWYLVDLDRALLAIERQAP